MVTKNQYRLSMDPIEKNIDYLPLIIGEVYETKFATKEKVKLCRIINNPSTGQIAYVYVIYLLYPNLGECMFDHNRLVRVTYNPVYITEMMKKFSLNISEYNIGEILLEKPSGKEHIITNKTTNSIEVFIPKKSEKGIGSYQWFDMGTISKTYTRKV